MDKVRLRLNKDELTIVEGEDSFIGKLIAGTKGKIKIKNPLMRREIRVVKNKEGKVVKGDFGKPKEGKAPK